MNLTIRKKSKEVKIDIDKIREIGIQAIYDLAPFFDVDKEELEEMKFPYFRYGNYEDNMVSYMPYKNRIVFPPKVKGSIAELIIKDNTLALGEEVGHWFHHRVNEPLFEESISKVDLNRFHTIKSISEYIGRYSNIILGGLWNGDKNNYFRHDRERLLNLVNFYKKGYMTAYKDFPRYGSGLLKHVSRAKDWAEIRDIKSRFRRGLLS